jgi:diguanylate cyclase (GGDEF)-like protein
VQVTCVRRLLLLTSHSLQAQFIAIGAVTILLTLLTVLMATGAPVEVAEAQRPGGHVRLVLALIGIGLMALSFLAVGVKWALRPLHQLRDSLLGVIDGKVEPDTLNPPRISDLAILNDSIARVVEQYRQAKADHESSKRTLAHRTQTVDRLLDFSQTIQGAGKADQIFQSLAFFLRSELSLSGLVIVAHDREMVPPLHVRSAWPAELVKSDSEISDMDCALCPCLRQNLPRHFRPDGSPVRCAIDRALNLPPMHPAYCIPFQIGRAQCVVHMLLPPDQAWDEQRMQLAQTYVNTAYSTLISLHLLAEAEKQSMTDPLTGLYNRRSMEQLLEREVALSERHGHPLSLVMIDMDHFKQINDGHGHAAGDHMLKAFADCVRITLRRTDLAFRFGGDEFVICLPQTPIAQAQQVVQKLRQAFAAVDFTDAVANLDHHPTLSIGVAERSKAHNVLTLSALLAAADQALYDAKADDRNCVRVYQPPKAA